MKEPIACIPDYLPHFLHSAYINTTLVGSEELLLLKVGVGREGIILQKLNFGKTSASIDSKCIIAVTDCVKIDGESCLMTLSKNAALYKAKIVTNNRSSEILTPKQVCYFCRHCLSVFKDHYRAKSHVMNLHIGPANCVMCGVEFIDLQSLKGHQTHCSFMCGVEGCGLKHKTLKDAMKHKKAFLKSL